MRRDGHFKDEEELAAERKNKEAQVRSRDSCMCCIQGGFMQISD
jgi:hypothetical protein